MEGFASEGLLPLVTPGSKSTCQRRHKLLWPSFKKRPVSAIDLGPFEGWGGFQLQMGWSAIKSPAFSGSMTIDLFFIFATGETAR